MSKPTTQELHSRLLAYRDRYEITVQYWPQQTAVYVDKDGVELAHFGGDDELAFTKSVQYLDRINGKGTK